MDAKTSEKATIILYGVKSRLDFRGSYATLLLRNPC